MKQQQQETETATDISDHLAQFLIIPKFYEHDSVKIICKRCFKNFNEDHYEHDLENTNWKNLLSLYLKDVNFSFAHPIQKVDDLLDKHAPYKNFKVKNNKNNKPWITNGLKTSINIKNNYHKKFIRAKDPKRKENLHTLYKAYKNQITNLSRRSKESYFKNLFEENKKNSFKIWQGIKQLINLKSKSRFTPTCLKTKETLITDKTKVANEFNNFFNSIASKIDDKIVKTNTHFHDSLKNSIEKIFSLIQPRQKKLKIN